MAVNNLQTQMGLDASQYIAAAQQQIQAMGGQAAGVDSLIEVSERFNRSGKVVGATVKALTNDYKTLTIEINKVTAAQRAAGEALQKGLPAAPTTPLSVRSRELTTGNKTPQSPILDPSKVAAGEAAAAQIRQQFPAPTNATIAQISKYETAIGKVQNLLQSGKISGQRFDEIFKAIQTGSLNKLTLTGDETKLVSALGDISKSFTTAKEASEKFLLSMKNVFRIAEALLLKEALGAIVSQLQRAILEAVNFQIKISEIRTLATENQASFQSWSKSIAAVSDALGIPQIEVAKAAYEALSAQIVSGKEETEQFVRAAGDLSRVGVSSIAESGKVLASIFNSYGISAGRAEEVSAKLFKAVDLGNFTIEQLGNHLGRVTGTASALGVSLDDMLGALTTLSRTSNPADSITQLGNVFLKLQKPTADTSKFLKSLGFDTGQAAVQALGFIGVLKEIEKATHGDVAALAEFGGELRAIRGLTGLTTRGKGGQFADDVNAIKNDSLDSFREAKTIRGESAGDQLTIEFNKIKNFFANDFGQSILNTFNKQTEVFGGFFNVVKVGTDVVVTLGKAYAAYIITTRTASIATNVFSTSLATVGLQAQNAYGQITLAGKAVNVFSTALKTAGTLAVFAVLLDELIKYKRELDDTVKKSEQYEEVLTRIKNARVGKTESGKTPGDQIFQNTALKESGDFGSLVDNLFRPLLQKEAEASRNAQSLLLNLRNEAKESAIQLQVAFKGTTDAINNTTKQYSENISKADKSILDSKKNILSLKETVQSIIFDLKNDFANDEQKFILRKQEIERLQNEAATLFQSNDPEDLAKAQKLAVESLQLRKQDIKARADAQIEEEKRQRTLKGVGEGSRFPDNSPIQPNLDIAGRQQLLDAAKNFEQLNKDVEARKSAEKEINQRLIEQDKERERLLTKRIQDLLKLQPIDENGKPNKDFTTNTGKFDENKFNVELEKRTKAVTDLLNEQEKATIGINELEKFKLSLIKLQRQELEAQKIATKQLETGKLAEDTKRQFEEAAKERIKASTQVDRAGKELDVSADIIRGFLDRTKSDASVSTIGQGENKFQEFGQRLTRAIIDGVNAIPGGGKIPVSQREEIANDPRTKELTDRIQVLQNQFQAEREKLTARDATGKPIGTQENIDNLGKIRGELLLNLNSLLAKFTGNLNNEDFAAPGGASLKELRDQLNGALKVASDAFNQEKAQVARQESLVSDLRNVFDPTAFAIAQQRAATGDNTGALNRNTTNIEGLIKELQAQKIVQPANIPVVPMNAFEGKHHGGLIRGPKGYDNILIRAEADEFIVNQTATKKWLPQLIAMNQGRSPRIPGHYHEGGLVQTTVGDVNVTITGPVSPDKNVRQIGNALRRSIRRGNLDLSSKR